MKNCANCKFSMHKDTGDWLCTLGSKIIKHPHFMGGPKKCHCYRKKCKKCKKCKKEDFVYPDYVTWRQIVNE